MEGKDSKRSRAKRELAGEPQPTGLLKIASWQDHSQPSREANSHPCLERKFVIYGIDVNVFVLGRFLQTRVGCGLCLAAFLDTERFRDL